MTVGAPVMSFLILLLGISGILALLLAIWAVMIYVVMGIYKEMVGKEEWQI